ncbi:helix-turn-helix domain-containing protein [Vibrio paucivorans]|uniref:Helix-turn-helix domain-containing protein n=1 Tax=Vibrio paucivorans TaxID=2829489 RepID=A0A9X3HTP8_9VIBR|nr:helix-turn-helix domain-containing protein [Vibrio paucivorans]MCW8335833.1 helix-turn-helix domain-containing protein [Vibrio paucivorans]
MSKRNKNIPLVRRENVEFFASLFEELDKKTYALLRESTIPLDIHDNPDYAYLPESCLKNFMEVLGESLSNDKLGVLFWRSCRETYVPKFVSLLTGGTTVREALQEFSDLLKRESSGANVYLQKSGGSWWLVREKAGADEVWFKYAELFSVMCMAEVLRALTDNAWRPTRIGVRSSDIEDFSSLPTLEQAQFFAERPVTALEIPEALLDEKAVITHTASQVFAANHYAEQSDDSFAATFKQAITPYVSVGKLPIKLAAEILRMNVRTLQRKLESEGIIYKTLIEEMVFDQIKHRLTSSSDSITSIANKFGYSDAAHFSRSFKRITGLTPSHFRKHHRK